MTGQDLAAEWERTLERVRALAGVFGGTDPAADPAFAGAVHLLLGLTAPSEEAPEAAVRALRQVQGVVAQAEVLAARVARPARMVH